MGVLSALKTEQEQLFTLASNLSVKIQNHTDSLSLLLAILQLSIQFNISVFILTACVRLWRDKFQHKQQFVLYMLLEEVVLVRHFIVLHKL